MKEYKLAVLKTENYKGSPNNWITLSPESEKTLRQVIRGFIRKSKTFKYAIVENGMQIESGSFVDGK